MLYYTEIALSYREVPGENSLCIYISGCPHHCAGCHYPELQRADYGAPLSEYYVDIVDLYIRQATCVCFMGEGAGGTLEQDELLEYATYAKKAGLKTCLYSGRDVIIEPWMTAFDYIKLGSFQNDKGPLTSPTTNQRMYRKDGRWFIDITHLFWI